MALSWGSSEASSLALAQAVVADVLGTAARCSACPTDTTCLICAGSGLRGWALEVADAFAAEVVARLPAEGFELPAAEVMAWLRRHVGVPSEVRVAETGVPRPINGHVGGGADILLRTPDLLEATEEAEAAGRRSEVAVSPRMSATGRPGAVRV